MEPKSSPTKRLVLVVHGIGDSRAGSTLRDMARAIAAVDGRSLDCVEEALWFEDRSAAGEGEDRETPPDRLIKNFACHVARLRDAHTNRETVLAEVHWADVSRVSEGLFSAVLGIIRLAFGLRHLAWHAADPSRGPSAGRDWAAAALRGLLVAIAHVLRGPMVAALLLWALMWIIGAAIMTLNPADLNALPVGINLGTDLIVAVVGLLGVRLGGRGTRVLFAWLAAYGLAHSCLFTVWYLTGQLNDFDFGITLAFNHSLASVPAGVVMLLMPIAAGAWLVARLRATGEYRPGLDLAQTVSLIAAFLLTLVINTLTVFLGQNLGAPESAADWFEKFLLPSITLFWILALLLVLVVAGTLGKHASWAKKSTAATYDPSRPAPRVLVGPAIVAFAILMSLVPLTVPLVQKWQNVFTALGRGNEISIAAILLIGSLVASQHELVRTGIDFGLDIVSYFRRVPSAAGATYPERNRVQQRLRTVLARMVERENPDSVTVLAHSLGTIVSVDVLAQPETGAALDGEPKVDLVTMASPLHHFHQRYFPNQYPPLADSHWNGLRQRVGSWVNIFRTDDVVGTAIEPDNPSPENPRPENLAVDPGGHINYWIDRQVLEILTARQLV